MYKKGKSCFFYETPYSSSPLISSIPFQLKSKMLDVLTKTVLVSKELLKNGCYRIGIMLRKDRRTLGRSGGRSAEEMQYPKPKCILLKANARKKKLGFEQANLCRQRPVLTCSARLVTFSTLLLTR